MCRTNDNNAAVIEFKKPSEKINIDHLNQAMQYRTIIKKSMPNLKNVCVYVIGKEYTQEILDNKESQSKAGNFFYSFLRSIIRC